MAYRDRPKIDLLILSSVLGEPGATISRVSRSMSSAYLLLEPDLGKLVHKTSSLSSSIDSIR
jgi:hypothetical protein